MSKLARVLVLGAMVAAMNLAGMTTVAHAYPLDPAADHAVAAQQQSTDAVELFRRGERASQEQTTADATVRRLLAREQSSIPSGTPAQVPVPVQPPEPTGSPTGWSLRSVCWPRGWRWSPGWSCWPPGARAAGCGPGRPPDTSPRTPTRWGCRAHPAAPSPCRRRVDRICCSLAPRRSRYPAVGSSGVTEDNLALDVRGPPGKTAVRMALS
jgi:hypothetical protein